jgi:hypothetical protein
MSRADYHSRATALWIAAGIAGAVCVLWAINRHAHYRRTRADAVDGIASGPTRLNGYAPKKGRDSSGFFSLVGFVEPWDPNTSLTGVAGRFHNVSRRVIAQIDNELGRAGISDPGYIQAEIGKVLMLNYEGEAEKAYVVLDAMRRRIERDDEQAREWLHTVIYLEGVVSLRLGENENCIMCRGESSCILPIASAAVHTNPRGSRQAIVHFTEYLAQFPDDLETRWLLNVAHMTLGEYPDLVDPRYLVPLKAFLYPEFDIGRFRDVGRLAGINRFNQSGGAILEDLDNDGLLDIVVTSIDPGIAMAVYRNAGDGTFTNCSVLAGVAGQLGGLNCVQTDFNNDGLMDIFVPRGAWFHTGVRPTLLANNGDGTFADVTARAHLLKPVNSNCGEWADYDNDGCLDLLVCCERQPNLLYHNEGDGTFTEVASEAGVEQDERAFCKGAAWLDYDNDDWPDLFLNNLMGTGRLYHNNRNGTFSDISHSLKIEGPQEGFPCWAWDYDNDGWIDIFATSYFRTVEGVVQGLTGQQFPGRSNRLYRNVSGRLFEDQTAAAGLNKVFAAMGCNYGDFDNDGYLDMYLGTGAPGYDFLVPNRLFKNVDGARFADVTASSGTGHLQKGHGVGCGDWDRDGDTDIFIQLGGPAPGDSYHNVLFENPGNANRWLTVKLTGVRTNAPAIGARLKLTTLGPDPRTIYRHVSSGSSFGANPLELTIGLGRASRVVLEVHWPASGTTQVFHDIDVNQAIEVTEFAAQYRGLRWEPIQKTGWTNSQVPETD